MPDGMVLHYRQQDANGQWQLLSWHTGHADHPEDPQPLHTLAAQLGTDSESIVRLTAEHNVGGVFSGTEFSYINGVFARSTVLLPPALTLRLGLCCRSRHFRGPRRTPPANPDGNSPLGGNKPASGYRQSSARRRSSAIVTSDMSVLAWNKGSGYSAAQWYA
jgi:hypothetical protein